MAYEDFTTYNVVDPNSRLTILQNKITWAALTMDDNVYVYKDFGVDHFAGDFEFLFEAYYDSLADTWGDVCFGGLANIIGNAVDVYNVEEGMWLEFNWDRLWLYSAPLGGWTNFECLRDTLYYITVSRVSTIITAKVYADAARTNLLATLIREEESIPYRYLYGVQSALWGGTDAGYGYIQNLDIQEEAPPGGRAKAMLLGVGH